MGNCYKAQEASFKSREYALAKDREGWLGLFADDAIVMDPVGVSPLDPTGLGNKGKEAIGAFYDMVIANADMEFVIETSIPAGDECANLIDLTNRMGDMVLKNKMIVVYTANDEGKIISLKAYWEYSKLQAQIDEQMAGQAGL